MTSDSSGRTRRRVLEAGGVLASLVGGGCLRLTGADDAPSTDATSDRATTDGETAAETTASPGGEPGGLDAVLRHALDGSFADAVNDVDGQPAASGLAFVDGDRGTALDLRGRGADSPAGYYDLPYARLDRYFDVGDPVTAAFWMRPTALDDWYAVLSGVGVTVSLRGGSLRLSRFNTETRRNEYEASVGAGRALDAGAWQHVVATVAPGAEARLFVDGVEVAATGVDADQGYQPKEASGIEAARVGFVPSGDDGAYDAHFEGGLDDLRLYRGSVDAAGADALHDAMRD